MIVSEDGRPTRNVTDRVGKASAAMKLLTRIWRHSALTERWKLKVYRMVIIPVLTYGRSLESLTPTDFRRLDGAHA